MKRFLVGLLAFVIAIAGIEPIALMAANTTTDEPLKLLGDIPGAEVNVPIARATTIDSGTCGDNVNWSIDSNYVLYITGTGEIKDYNKKETPWFEYANNITTIVGEAGITRIGDFAFAYLPYLTTLQGFTGLSEIGYAAFFACTEAEGVWQISSKVTMIEAYAFAQNLNSEGFDVAEDNPRYCSYNGHLMNKDMTELRQAANLNATELNIPSSVTCIGNGALWMSKVRTIENNNIDTLYGDALHDCKYLHTVKMNGLKYLGGGAFSGCTSLESITIPKTTEQIYEKAFENCTSLSEITFKGDAPIIEENAFLNVEATASYYVGKSGWSDEIKQNYGGNITWKGLKSANTITASNISKVVSSSKRTVDLEATVKGGAKLTYKSNNDNITVNSNGKVTIKKNYIGKATITITAASTSKYKKATKKITVTVKPVKATITSTKNNKKSTMHIKVKKNIGSVKYQIQIANDSKFEDRKNYYNKYNSDGYIVNGLEKGKTYYVRVRGYKKVGDNTYYGKWSDVKKVKISK